MYNESTRLQYVFSSACCLFFFLISRKQIISLEAAADLICAIDMSPMSSLFTWTPSLETEEVSGSNAPLQSCFSCLCSHMSCIPVVNAGVPPVCGCDRGHTQRHKRPLSKALCLQREALLNTFSLWLGSNVQNTLSV